MSGRSFADFTASINTDDALRTALTERFGDLSQDIAADELIDFAGKHGYTFSVEEAENQLSEEALEGVAGGLSIGVGELSNNFEEIKVTYLKYDGTASKFNFYMKY